MKIIYQLGKALILTAYLGSAIACGGNHSHGEETPEEEKKKHGHSHSAP